MVTWMNSSGNRANIFSQKNVHVGAAWDDCKEGY